LLAQRDAMLRAITCHFPAQTCVSRPEGGYFVWVALPPGSPDAMSLLHSGEPDAGCFAPGPLFSPTGGFGMHLRLNFGHPWTAQLDGSGQATGRAVSAPLDAMRTIGAAAAGAVMLGALAVWGSVAPRATGQRPRCDSACRRFMQPRRLHRGPARPA